jgi:hypothetical protein
VTKTGWVKGKKMYWYKYPESHWKFRVWRFFARSKKIPGNIWWWVRYHTTDRYHILDLRHKGYPYGWRDVPEKMEMALFALLVDFVEKEKGFEGHVDWDYNREVRAVRAKAMELHEWWTRGQHREDEFLALITRDAPSPMEFVDIPGSDCSEMVLSDHPRWGVYTDYRERFEAKRERMMTLLLSIRKYLWT